MLKASEKGYQADRIDFLNLLDSYRDLESFKLDYHRAVADYHIAIGELEVAVGRSLTGT